MTDVGHHAGLKARTRAQASTTSVTTDVAEMFAFAAERHAIFLRRQRGEPWPWSDDKILSTFFFNNIFRDLDKTTAWIRWWLGQHLDHPNLLLAACLVRRINHPPSLEELGFPHVWDPQHVSTVLRDRMARGDKTFNPNAYRLVGRAHEGSGLVSAATSLVGRVWGLREAWPRSWGSVREALTWLSSIEGWGPMISYQVVLDLVGSPLLPQPGDLKTWCHVGPGAIRGLNRVLGRPLETFLEDRKITGESDRLDEIRWLQSLQGRYWPRRFPELRMGDVENSLCEYDKFIRICEGNVTGQRKYSPEKATW